MKERGILFSGPMVRAILEGRKTMTRRPVKPQPKDACWLSGHRTEEIKIQAPFHSIPGIWNYRSGAIPSAGFKCPYGQPGDRLWVKEAFLPVPAKDRVYNSCVYMADGEMGLKYFSGARMGKRYSRIFLEITSVRVERIQDISWVDLENEGYEGVPNDLKKFTASWNATYPGSWDRNDFRWVISFKRITLNPCIRI